MDITSDLIETDLADLRRVSFEKISSGSRAHPSPGTGRHRLSAAAFAALSAGDGSAQLTRNLWSAEESRRMLLVGTLLTEIGANPAVLGPLPPIAGVVDALAAAQRNAPGGVRRLLRDPQTAGGCEYARRRLRGGAPGADQLWVDLGVAHALALAAAASAGLTWSTRLPVWHGTVGIPGLGRARFADTGAVTVEAHTEDGDIRLSDGEHEVLIPATASDVDDRWWPLRTLRVGDDLPLTVRLDDLDPFRDPAGPTAPARLGTAAVRRWHGLFDGAWDLLCRDHRGEAEAVAEGVVSIVPGHAAGTGSGIFGRVLLTEPADAVGTAVALIDGYRRLELGTLRHLVPLTEPDDGARHQALRRDEPGPLDRLLQSVHAHFRITRFWRLHRDTANGAYEYAYARRQTVESLHTALAAPGLTPRGRQLVEGLRDRLDAWSNDPADPLDPPTGGLATITADSQEPDAAQAAGP